MNPIRWINQSDCIIIENWFSLQVGCACSVNATKEGIQKRIQATKLASFSFSLSESCLSTPANSSAAAGERASAALRFGKSGFIRSSFTNLQTRAPLKKESNDNNSELQLHIYVTDTCGTFSTKSLTSKIYEKFVLTRIMTPYSD